MDTYQIRRSFPDKPSKLIKSGVTLEEAKKHCNDPKTRKAGKWFDFYTEE